MVRVLFVDDEPGIRDTLPLILAQNGFATKAVASVSEALAAIMSEKFDLLLSDLNIGEPGDGFTVISAMHKVDPTCRTIILTGFPAFETALQAIRAQVDDYVIKPANIPVFIETIHKTLNSPPQKLPPQGKRLSVILREHRHGIVGMTLDYMKADPQLGSIDLDDAERIDHLLAVIEQLAALLESERPDQVPVELIEHANYRGRLCYRQGFTSDMLVSEARVFLTSLNDVVEENLLAVDMSHLVVDSKWLRESVLQQLAESVRALSDAERELAT